MTSSHTLPIQIDPACVPILRACGLTLCLAEGITINGSRRNFGANVVFASIPPNELGENVSFVWRDEWRVCETYGFNHLRKAKPYTYPDCHPVALGQTATLDSSYANSTTTSPSPTSSTSFQVAFPCDSPGTRYKTRTVVEVYDAPHERFSPILVSDELRRGDEIEFTPNARCWVWFDGLLEGGRMFEEGKTQRWPFEVDLSKEKAVKYEDGVWRYA